LSGSIKDSFGRCWDVNGDGTEDCDSVKSWEFYTWPLGDYNHDAVVNGDDVADFTSAWNVQDTSKEIGPTSGVPPHLLCNPDGKIDFEDLVILVWMWNWFHQAGYVSPSIYAGGQSIDFDNCMAFSPDSEIGQNESEEFGLVLKDVKDVMVVSILLEYDPAKLRIESTREGSLFSKDGAKTLFLKSIENNLGITEIVCSRLNGVPMGVEGTEPVARIRVKALTRVASEPVIVHYKIWNSQAMPVVFGHSSVNLNSEGTFPQKFELLQNYPNPFNPQTAISYKLARSSLVSLIIYNVAGQKVRTLVAEHQVAGDKTAYWNGRDDNGNEVTSGIYFYRIKAGEFTQTKKMVILK